MNKSGDLRSFSGQLGSVVKKTVDQVVKEPAEAFEKVEEQAGVKPTANQKSSDDNKPAEASDNTNMPSSKVTLEVVKKMYEKSDIKVNIPSDQTISELIEKNPKKTPEEIQKMAATRQQLWQQQHMSTYFEPTFNPPKKQEQRPAEEIEKEKKEKKQIEALELQKEEKKKEELSPAVKQGTVEKNPGISG